jgi:proteasome lid subunit RPN8/RPN11
MSGPQRIVRRIKVSRDAMALIRRQLESAYPEEACGALLADPDDREDRRVIEAVPLANDRGDERGRRYLIGPADVLALERRAEERELSVAGYYHSHPDAPADPSEYDREHAWPWYVYLIVSVREGRAVDERAWELSEDRGRFESVDIEETSHEVE